MSVLSVARARVPRLGSGMRVRDFRLGSGQASSWACQSSGPRAGRRRWSLVGVLEAEGW